ncbi:DUF6133 family protein [Sinanaerobacter sp. ZZT-01]|uniref:DUF6133 family protein n=1 Tax=Sinanaerobacter sp. ZZT-01 TaxID=3111540 RepID=UPI002D77EF2A|nr:DUF6133 family protein [Sinanaerobacter sp. ZZT-01]WRR93916.1 DUF6133 family protein [Sinanaerobacter sp. ZZT-01]
MKNFMNKVISKVNDVKEKGKAAAIAGALKFQQLRTKSGTVLAQQSGEGFVDTALKILISVVIGALLLAGLYMLFNDTVLPTLVDRVKELFNYRG